MNGETCIGSIRSRVSAARNVSEYFVSEVHDQESGAPPQERLVAAICGDAELLGVR